ncbi:hypothetical protein VTL71DRAFT_7330 [Oculimacula yallundae]|uniref:Heterokaryon incompatibility domain-containing protein n=1 Tax=Oculimacula yallundae TaxID=86028 RepID=A0ABR4BX92_9HELO
MASYPPLPDFLWSRPVETDHYEEYQPFRPSSVVDGSLCEACKAFCESILNGRVFSDEGWKHEITPHRGITHIERYAWASHHDGIFVKLQASAKGCDMCALFVEFDKLSPEPWPRETFPDEPASPEDIRYRLCIDRRDEGTEETEASHLVAIEFYNLSTGPEIHRGYRSMGGPPVATPRLPKHSNFCFVRRGDDTNPRALFTESLFHEDPYRKVVVKQSGWPILLSADAEDRASVQALMRARKWIWKCLRTHPHCARKMAELPKRVIDIGTSLNDPIRLHIPNSITETGTPYIALSYSWGTELPLRTTKATLQKHCEGIPFEDFPRTLQDALHVTRGLGLRYIWIDALCIVQDDAQDWEEQAALMGNIYQGSLVNISATCSTSLSAGFLQRSENSPFPRVKVGRYFHKDGINHGGIFLGTGQDLGSNNMRADLNGTFLSSRGWVFQEQLMSTATLHYTADQMIWECATTIRSEKFADAEQVNVQPKLDGYDRLAPLKWGWINYLRSAEPQSSAFQKYGSRTPVDKNEDGFSVLMALWKEWVFDFSSRDLTYGNDRLPAIAGITQLISQKYGLRFAVGHFEEDLPLSLCWWPRKRRQVVLGSAQKSTNNYPSWSWPSFQGGVWYGGSTRVYQLQITSSQASSDLRIVKLHSEPGSSVYLEVEGLLQQIELERKYDQYKISAGVKRDDDFRWYNWEVRFDNGSPAQICSPHFLLRVVGYDSNVLHFPCNATDDTDKPCGEIDPELRATRRRDYDAIWCLLLEEILPCAAGGLRSFRRVGMAETRRGMGMVNKGETIGEDFFVKPQKSTIRLV